MLFWAVQGNVRRLVLRRVDSWLLLATSVGLFGCPLLLDDFGTATLSHPDAGEACIGVGCAPPSRDGGGSSGTGSGGSGSAGAASTGGTTSSAGSGGASAGAGGSAGSGGASGSAGAGGSTGEGGAGTACWTLELSSTYGSGSNCVGVTGTSNVVADTGTTLGLSYDNGDPCFSGTIASSGWGATYELTFDDEEGGAWNASGAGVTGFEFAYRGSEQPSSVRVYYKDPSGVDNCYVIGPGSTPVPFSAAHPGCNSSGNTVDSARMAEMILAFIPKSQPYDVDFCIQIRALD